MAEESPDESGGASLEEMSPEEAGAHLESAGYVNQGTSAEDPSMDTYVAELADGLAIAIDVPRPADEDGVESRNIALGWDPLPYLYGTGEQWAEFAQTALTGGAAIACAPINAFAAGACAGVANMIVNDIGRPGEISNANQCYVMKSINLPPEEAPASESS